MRRYLTLVFACTLIFGLTAQGQQFSKTLYSPVTGKLEFAEFNSQSRIPVSEFQTWARKELQLSNDDALVLVGSESDQFGYTHYSFQQTHKGHEVMGGQYKVHAKGGTVYSVNGRLFDMSSKSAFVSQTADDALSIAITYVDADMFSWQLETEEAYLKSETGDPNATYKPSGELVWVPFRGEWKKTDWRLTWKFDVYALEPYSRQDVYVGANHGEIVFVEQKIHSTNVPGTAETKYSGVRTIVTDSIATDSFHLQEHSRGSGDGVHTRNKQGGTNAGNAVEFTDSDNYWSNFNADLDEAATDAHWGAEMTYDWLQNKHSRNSYDNKGSELRMFVHHGNSVFNAFWNGSSANFGDGNNRPLTGPDVVAHEIGHGVTGNSAGLVYQAESGGLNESFSDIIGNAVEFYARGTINWMIGEDAYAGSSGMRDMSDPSAFGDPDTYQGSNWVPTDGPCDGSNDNCGVHTNSGVQNHWFYLLTDGGSGVNDNQDTFLVSGIGIDKAGQIAIRNLTVYLTSWSDYTDARFFSIQSAIDIFGGCSTEMISTMNAWHAVGIGAAYDTVAVADFIPWMTHHCEVPAEVQFSDNSVGAVTYNWSFGDLGVANVPNPKHTYQTQGTYTVTLTIGDCAGNQNQEIKTNLIVVDPNQPCTLALAENTTDTITGCSGTLYDSGGNMGNYKDNNFSMITIAPQNALTVSINFAMFDFASAGDFIRVYDGPDATAPMIGIYNGNSLPNGGTINSTGPTLTIEERSNGFLNAPGFELSWSCAVGIEDDLPMNKITVAPNPFGEMTLVTLPEAQSGKWQLMNVSGQVMREGNFQRQTQFEVSGDGLAEGFYFLRVDSEGKLGMTLKLAIE